MIDNLRTRILFILLLLGVAGWSLVSPLLRGESVFTLGLDLKGGVVLRYLLPEVGESEATSVEASEEVATTIEIYRDRLDATGIKEFDIRPVGSDQIEIGIPGISADEADSYKETLQSIGRLEFRLEATTEPGIDIDELYRNLALEIQERKNRGETITRDSDFSELTQGLGSEAEGYHIRLVPISEKYQLAHREFLGIPEDKEEPDFLAVRYETQEGRFFSGEDISEVRPEVDPKTGLPAVGFTIRPGRPQSDFGKFTASNINKNLTIVLDGQVQSNPNISSKIPGRGIISGGTDGFTQEELRRLIAVIKSGSLPLKPTLYSQTEVGPTLGEVAIRRGLYAGSISIGLVLVFLTFFYLKAGLVACSAMLVNILFLMGALAFLDATLTLPGIAGLVLTIGMAVDANILIFERIREEMEKGKTIAQSVRNGFDKAFFTIVDSNATTFLTAVFLYKFGSGPIRGFAVTLMIGLASSMFAALYFSKTVFAILLERKLEKLKMVRLLADTSINFLAWRKQAILASTVAILIGLVLFLVQGSRLYGMDFAGGYEVQLGFKNPTTQAQVLQRIQGEFPSVGVVSVGAAADGTATQFQIKDKSTTLAETVEGDPAEQFGRKLRATFGAELLDEPIPSLVLEEADAQGRVPVRCSLRYAGDVRKADLEAALRSPTSPLQDVQVEGPEQGAMFDVSGLFTRAVASEDGARVRITQAVRQLPAPSGEGLVRLSNPMPSRSFIGPKAGVELRDKAIQAMFFSLLGIILYIRIRFRQYRYGIAACVALVHDVLFTLGVLAMVSPILAVEIDLAIIAAFLTIIGYSLNDTIVIFDRVRENLPRLDQPLEEVLNRSVNQTLTRTILTSGTTLIAVALLFLFNLGQRNVLEGFAFSLMIGIVAGTYSTVFIASPVVIWLTERIKQRKEAMLSAPAKAPAKA